MPDIPEGKSKGTVFVQVENGFITAAVSTIPNLIVIASVTDTLGLHSCDLKLPLSVDQDEMNKTVKAAHWAVEESDEESEFNQAHSQDNEDASNDVGPDDDEMYSHWTPERQLDEDYGNVFFEDNAQCHLCHMWFKPTDQEYTNWANMPQHTRMNPEIWTCPDCLLNGGDYVI